MDLDIFKGSLCKLFFTSITFSMVIIGAFVNICEPYLPIFISRTFRYGKFASQHENALVRRLEVPKSYFKHFYLISVIIYCPVVFSEVISAYIFDSFVPQWFINVLDFTCGTNRTATVSTTRVFIAVLLLLIQIGRRFFDTHFISVFSDKARMNLSHYVIGMLHYPALMLIILSEAPKFAPTGLEDDKLRLSEIGFIETAAVILFLWAWYHQHVASVILANLRKNKNGDVVSQTYKIPQGDWFRYVSSPHSTAEILMYTALTMLLASNSGWWFVYVWVISNQVETILLSHWWYQSKFKEFPKNRKALIPFVY